MPPLPRPVSPDPARVNSGLAVNTLCAYLLARITGHLSLGLLLLVLLATLATLASHPLHQRRTSGLLAGLLVVALLTSGLAAALPELLSIVPALLFALWATRRPTPGPAPLT